MSEGALSIDPADRHRLLSLARAAVAARLADEPFDWRSHGLSPAFDRKGGAFVTLTRRADHELRGCVGYVEALFPLGETVARAAVLAATEDHRFPVVRPDELPTLAMEISLLSPLLPIRPEEVRIGTHGLMIRHGGSSGLLLPQVPEEHGWDLATFLDQTCRKAGLPPGDWRHPDTELRGFTATVFGED